MTRSVAQAIHSVLGEPPEVGVVAHDGSTAGDLGGTVMRLRTPPL